MCCMIKDTLYYLEEKKNEQGSLVLTVKVWQKKIKIYCSTFIKKKKKFGCIQKINTCGYYFIIIIGCGAKQDGGIYN